MSKRTTYRKPTFIDRLIYRVTFRGTAGVRA